MRYTGAWTIAITAVVAATLASSGVALAQSKDGAKASAAKADCVTVKGGGCVTSKAGTPMTFKGAKPAPSEASNGKDQKQSAQAK